MQMQHFALSAILLVCPPLLFAQATSQPSSNSPQQEPQAQTKQETPQPQKNPAAQANLPNAPSSIITGKPHRQGQVPLEDIPHPPVKLLQTPLNILGDSYRMFTSPIYIRGGDLKWMLPLAAGTGVALSQDTHVAKDIVSHDPGFNNANDTVSSDLLYG